MSERQSHWQTVYTTRAENEVSWFQESPAISLALISAAGATNESSIIDIGGGTSRLVDYLLNGCFRSIAVLDLSSAALATAKTRIGSRSDKVEWIVSDVAAWKPYRQFEIWHDRAAFHFLTDQDDRKAYVTALMRATRPGSQVIIGTFAPDGPEKCSGLSVQRYSAETLGEVLGETFRLIESRRETHTTPWESTQSFEFCRFERI